MNSSMVSPSGILVRPHAKINVGLRVLSRRPDGFHEIETIFYEVNCADELELHHAEGISMESSSPEAPANADNLCMKAAALLRQWSGYEHGVHIKLTKQIPVGGGLGGGSSDAAAVLLALNKLWNLSLATPDLQRLAGQLGSDTAFFICGGSAHAVGRGEMLHHGSFTVPYWILLVTPPIHVSTAWAYQHVIPRGDEPGGNLDDVFDGDIGRSPDLLMHIENDFERSVFVQHPSLREIKQHMEEAGAVLSLMSGSGSSVFGFFRDEADANKAGALFPSEYRISLTPPAFRVAEPRLRALSHS